MTAPLHKCAWIIGGHGFLGAELCACLSQAGGFRPLVIDPRLAPEHGGGMSACVQEPGVIDRALAAVGEPDLVFFCAATHGGDAAAYRRAYQEPVQSVAAAAPRARLVFCSSTSVYEGQGAVSELSPTPGSSEKLRILLEAEQAVLRAHGVVARLAPLYGQGRCELLRRHVAGEPQLPGSPERMLNYLHVADAAHALYVLGTAPQLRYSVYNVCGESFTKAQAYSLLETLTGIPASRTSSPAGRRGISDHRILSERMHELFVPRRRLEEEIRVAGAERK